MRPSDLPSVRNQEVQALIEKLISDLGEQQRTAQQMLDEFKKLGKASPTGSCWVMSCIVDSFVWYIPGRFSSNFKSP